MVSNASVDLPDPESPVMTTNFSRGILTSMFFKLWVFAPLTVINWKDILTGETNPFFPFPQSLFTIHHPHGAHLGRNGSYLGRIWVAMGRIGSVLQPAFLGPGRKWVVFGANTGRKFFPSGGWQD